MPSTDEKEVLAGLVERVTFHNEENGFCVLRVKVRWQKDFVTVLGHAAAISAGERRRAASGKMAGRMGCNVGLSKTLRYETAWRFHPHANMWPKTRLALW
jgi:hypothetical protein